MDNDGKQTYNTKYYNLDMIISIGFRANSKKAIKFRTWENMIIKDYMVQGFALNNEIFINQKITDIFPKCSVLVEMYANIQMLW